VADACFLGSDALVVAAVLFLAGPEWRSSRLRRVLDGGVIAAALLLLSWLTALRAVVASGGGAADHVVDVTYAVGDVITVVVALSALSFVRRLDPAMVLVAVATVGFAISDSAYAYLGYARPNFLDVAYLGGNLLIGLAALLQGSDRSPQLDVRTGVWRVALPYVPLLLAGGAAITRVLERQAIDAFAQVLMAAVVGLVLARQLAAVVESQTLSARLDRTLAELRLTLAEREILIEHAPIGICRLDAGGRVLAANPALHSTLGRPASELLGAPILDFLDPDDRERERAFYGQLVDGEAVDDHLQTEGRFVRGDGRSVWCSQIATVVRDAEGRPESFIGIVEDVSEQRRQAERAARIQRQLLPQEPPRIAGYEVAGACRPAQDVAGDLYDWTPAPDGRLDLTVADVMGKGVPAALVMAVLRTALRSAPPGLGPAERVRMAAESLAPGMSEDGLFVTLFQARLDPRTGLLQYVDAGHGHCAIRLVGGELVGLPVRSLPLGIDRDERFREGAAQLGPGEALVVYSDGLVEREGRTLRLSDVAVGLDAGMTAAELVARLLEAAPSPAPDDVTVVVLRRCGEDAWWPPGAAGPGPDLR
jgi:PAS domain S-box-containing protein